MSFQKRANSSLKKMIYYKTDRFCQTDCLALLTPNLAVFFSYCHFRSVSQKNRYVMLVLTPDCVIYSANVEGLDKLQILDLSCNENISADDLCDKLPTSLKRLYIAGCKVDLDNLR